MKVIKLEWENCDLVMTNWNQPWIWADIPDPLYILCTKLTYGGINIRGNIILCIGK